MAPRARHGAYEDERANSAVHLELSCSPVLFDREAQATGVRILPTSRGQIVGSTTHELGDGAERWRQLSARRRSGTLTARARR